MNCLTFSYLVFCCVVVLAKDVTRLASAYRLVGKEQNKANIFSEKNADPTCKPNPLLNFASDENCLIQSTLNGLVRGTRQLSSASGTDVDVFLGVSFIQNLIIIFFINSITLNGSYVS